MIAYALTAKIINIFPLKEGSKGYRINISLGGMQGASKGFANIIWSWGENHKQTYAPQIGDYIFVPKFDMSLSSWTNPATGLTTQTLTFFTSYLEKGPDFKGDARKAKEAFNKLNEATKQPTINTNVDTKLNEVNWDDDTLAESEKVVAPIVITKDPQEVKKELDIIINDDNDDDTIKDMRAKQEEWPQGE